MIINSNKNRKNIKKNKCIKKKKDEENQLKTPILTYWVRTYYSEIFWICCWKMNSICMRHCLSMAIAGEITEALYSRCTMYYIEWSSNKRLKICSFRSHMIFINSRVCVLESAIVEYFASHLILIKFSKED